MTTKGFKQVAWYFAALLAVCFGMEWGFSYILNARREAARGDVAAKE
jgi:hypothetical protein